MPMNLVLHSFIYPVIDLKGKKRVFCDVPACVFPADLNPGMKFWKQDFRSVSFEELRMEFLAVHLKGGVSLCFSPNNLKFELDPEEDISHFFSLALSTDGFYIVTYHWNINHKKYFKDFNAIFDKALNT